MWDADEDGFLFFQGGTVWGGEACRERGFLYPFGGDDDGEDGVSEGLKVDVLNVATAWELWDSGSNPSRDIERRETSQKL
jgi:hypothetical protein